MNRRGAVSWLALAVVATVIVIAVVGWMWYRSHLKQLALQLPAPKPVAAGPAVRSKPRAPHPRPPVHIVAIARPAFEIIGPLKDRPIEHKVLPQYPEWAEEKGVEGKVRLFFKVNRDGGIGPNISVVQTIGYPEFDAVAVDALKQWKFAPVASAPDVPYQTGYINFNFWLAR